MLFTSQRMKKYLLILVTIIPLCACLTSDRVIKKSNFSIKQVSFSALKNWDQDQHLLALKAFVNSCKSFSLMYDYQEIGGKIAKIQIADLKEICDIATIIKDMDEKYAKIFFENWFVPFQVSDNDNKSQGLFTGYFEINLSGSRVKTGRYKYPIYSRPKDLGKDLYYSRKDIDNGAISGENLELLYVDDPVELFLLHIQGSGSVTLRDDKIVKIGYNGSNNMPYTSISKYFINNKIFSADEISATTITNWLSENQQQANAVMHLNESYIFFKLLDSDKIKGALGAPLTPERSLAIDKSIIPLGLPIYIDTKVTRADSSKETYRRLMVAQDTGSAIKGAIRGDIFFGASQRARDLASNTKNYGKYYILLPANIISKIK